MFDRRTTLFTYEMEAEFYRKLFNAKKPLDAQGLLDCYEVLRRQLQRKPLCNFMYIEAVLDAIKESDLSVLDERNRAFLNALVNFYPERLINNANLMYTQIGTINAEVEDPEWPRFYRQYAQYADYEAALKPDERFPSGSELGERMDRLQLVTRPIIQGSNLIASMNSYLKYKGSDVVIDDNEFENDYVMPLLVTIAKFQKATSNQEKIKLYIDAFTQLKKLVTCMYDTNVRVFGAEHFTKLPIIDTEPLQLDAVQAAPAIMKM